MANAFFRSGEIELWGRGIERIFRACKEAGFPTPLIEHEGAGWWAKFTFPRSVVDRLRGQSGGKTPVKTPVKTPDMILAALATNPEMSLAEVAARLEKSLRAVERAAGKLVQSRRLKRIGPAKRGHWEILE